MFHTNKNIPDEPKIHMPTLFRACKSYKSLTPTHLNCVFQAAKMTDENPSVLIVATQDNHPTFTLHRHCYEQVIPQLLSCLACQNETPDFSSSFIQSLVRVQNSNTCLFVWNHANRCIFFLDYFEISRKFTHVDDLFRKGIHVLNMFHSHGIILGYIHEHNAILVKPHRLLLWTDYHYAQWKKDYQLSKQYLSVNNTPPETFTVFFQKDFPEVYAKWEREPEHVRGEKIDVWQLGRIYLNVWDHKPHNFIVDVNYVDYLHHRLRKEGMLEKDQQIVLPSCDETNPLWHCYRFVLLATKYLDIYFDWKEIEIRVQPLLCDMLVWNPLLRLSSTRLKTKYPVIFTSTTDEDEDAHE